MASEKRQRVGTTYIHLKSGKTIEIPRYTESNVDKPQSKSSGGGGGSGGSSPQQVSSQVTTTEQQQSPVLKASPTVMTPTPSPQQARFSTTKASTSSSKTFSPPPAPMSRLSDAASTSEDVLRRQGYVVIPSEPAPSTQRRFETASSRGPTMVDQRFVPPRQQTATLTGTSNLAQSGTGLFTPLPEIEKTKLAIQKSGGSAQGLPYIAQPLRVEVATQLAGTGSEKTIKEIELGVTEPRRPVGERVEEVPFDIAGGFVYPESIVGTAQEFSVRPVETSQRIGSFITTPRGALGLAGTFLIGGGGFRSFGKPKLKIGGAIGDEVGVVAKSSTLVEDIGGGLTKTTVKTVGQGEGKITVVEPKLFGGGGKATVAPIEFRGVATESTITQGGALKSSSITTESFSATPTTGLKMRGIVTRTGEEGTVFMRESGTLFLKRRSETVPVDSAGFAELIGSDSTRGESFFRTGAIQIEGRPKTTTLRPTTSIVKITQLEDGSPSFRPFSISASQSGGSRGIGSGLMTELKPTPSKQALTEPSKSALASSIGTTVNVQAGDLLKQSARTRGRLRTRGAAFAGTRATQSLFTNTKVTPAARTEPKLFQPTKSDLLPRAQVTPLSRARTLTTPVVRPVTTSLPVTLPITTPLTTPPTTLGFGFPRAPIGGLPVVTGGFSMFEFPTRRGRTRKQPRKYSPSLSGIIAGKRISRAPTGTLTGVAIRGEVLPRLRRRR